MEEKPRNDTEPISWAGVLSLAMLCSTVGWIFWLWLGNC